LQYSNKLNNNITTMEIRLPLENNSPTFFYTLGGAYNSFTSTPVSASPFTFESSTENLQSSSTHAQMCYNQNELNEALGLNIHGSAAINALSTIGASAKIDSNYDNSNQLLTIVTTVIVKSKRRSVNNPVLKPEANFTTPPATPSNVTPNSTPTSEPASTSATNSNTPNASTSSSVNANTVVVNNPESFFVRYGDRFCKEIIYGAKLVMLFKFHNVLKKASSESKLNFNFKLLHQNRTNVSLNDLGGMIEGLSSQYFMTMEWKSYGGPMLQDADASDIVAFCEKFYTQVNEKNEVPIEVSLIPYSDLRSFIPTTFDDCRNNLPLYLNNAKTLRNILVGDSLSPEMQRKVQDQYNSLLVDIDKIVKAYTKLFPSEFVTFSALGLKSPEEYATETRNLLKTDQPDCLQNGKLFALSYQENLHGTNLWYVGSSIPAHFTNICNKWVATVRHGQKINLKVEVIQGNQPHKATINIASTERCTENSPYLYHDLNLLDGLVWSEDRLDKRAQWVVVPKSNVPQQELLKFGQVVFIKNKQTKKYLAPKSFNGLFVLSTDSVPHPWVISRPRYIRED